LVGKSCVEEKLIENAKSWDWRPKTRLQN